MIKIAKKGEYFRLKIYEKKSPLMICGSFKSISGPEDNGKQNSDEFYTNKYQKHVTCSYGYKLVCIDDTFSKPFQ